MLRHQGGLAKRWWLAGVALVLALVWLAWTLWTEQAPEQERELRILVQEQLETWFPEAMTLPDELLGFIPRSEQFDDSQPPDVIMLHGLDEPGGIFDELAEALDAAGINGWEFRYPNDQAIDMSADLLAEHWPTLPEGNPVVLVGHSMGGLVIRDFVTRHLHGHEAGEDIEGPMVAGVIMVGTPNQGSDWVRLRAWLELREHFADISEGRFSLFAGLRDGTGAAKIDLRPDSAFLEDLNRRPWPAAIPTRIIGGLLTEPSDEALDSIAALKETLNLDFSREIERWWADGGEQIGDGVVPVESLALPESPEPDILPASHRGLLVTLPMSEGKPPAINPVIEQARLWLKPASQTD
ncbi:MAG: alpha/beta fold hydrolase [Wenzhouxiangella sp.]|nr:alpha/beta fold hydrolase [Wenzhouxiangella sp.]MCH8477324.1 alpha/beta hydrolase [Wenzhouxiangella sp.]TVR94902.1 MAG: alpha/beta fold hydrolase [Wenzhouxiangellaceae bacterium]